MRHIEHAVEAMCDDELIKVIRNVVQHPEYSENAFTPMIRSIASQAGKLSAKQKSVVKAHLQYTSKLWY